MGANQPEGTQAFTLYLPVALHERLKIQSVREKRPMVQIVSEAVRNYVDVFEITDRADATP